MGTDELVDHGQADSAAGDVASADAAPESIETWSDRANTVRVARRRVVKDVWQNPLVPWMARSFPDMPIVVILRHPIASAWSVVRLNWDVY